MYPLHISIHNIIINSSELHIIPYHKHNHTIPTIPFQSSEQQPCYKAFAIHKFLNREECKSLSKCVFSFEMENKMKNQPHIGHTLTHTVSIPSINNIMMWNVNTSRSGRGQRKQKSDRFHYMHLIWLTVPQLQSQSHRCALFHLDNPKTQK